MTSFDHFIITRFNLKQSIWTNDKHGDLVNDEKWLNERFEIFERYCFPTIKNQTVKDFKWLVYFDNDTPKIFKDKNRQLQETCRTFIPMYVSSFTAFEDSLPHDVSNLTKEKQNYIITTRLDNDDALHEDAVKVIQQQFEAQDKMVVDLTHGISLQVFKEYKLSLKKHTISGPFISLIEFIDNNKIPLTVYNREHTAWNDIATFKLVSDGFYWLQIIHRRNITNELSNELTYNKSYLKGFHILDSVDFKFKYYAFIILKRLKMLRYLKRIVN